jgi:hypothetical protein
MVMMSSMCLFKELDKLPQMLTDYLNSPLRRARAENSDQQ